MNDKSVIVPSSGSSSDDENVTNKRKRMAPVPLVAAAATATEEERRSGGWGVVDSITIDEESGVIFKDSDSQLLKSNKRMNKRRKTYNRIDDDDMERDVADLGTSEMDVVIVPDDEKITDFIEEQRGEQQTSKLEDVETGKATVVGENVESMDVRISPTSEDAISVKEEAIAYLNNSNVDGAKLLTQPLVNAVVEGEHPDTVQALGIDGKQADGDKRIEMLVMSGTELVLESSNSIVRMLLRGPRYFNPRDGEMEVCRNCGEEGHKTIMCTSKQRMKPCFVCGGIGHSGKKCKKGQVCFHCKRIGHASKKCPNKNEDCSLISCLRCGDSGHDMWKCDNEFPQDDLKEIQCYICKNFGHLCCVAFPDLGSRQVSCYNCGHCGHMGSECTEVVEKKPIIAKYRRKCGAKDHRARKGKKRAKATAKRAAKAERSADAERAAKAEKVAKTAKPVKAEKAAKVAKVVKVAKAHRTEVEVLLGPKFAPHDLYRPQREIQTSYEVRPGALQLRSRNGMSNIRSNLRYVVPGSNVWRAPKPIAQPNVGLTPAYFSPDFLNPQNPFQTLSRPPFSGNNHGAYASTSSVPYSSHQNITQTLHFPSPGSHPYQSATNYQRTGTPYPPTLVFNSPPFPSPQAYFPIKNNQVAASSIYAPRDYPNSGNPVQMLSQPTPPYQPRFRPPWPGYY